MKRVFGGGRYANVTSTMALVVALGGTSYAAITLPANSVGSKQIKKNGVASSDIRSNAVTSPKVKDGSLLAKDFKAGQLPAGPRGATGPAGPAGAVGPLIDGTKVQDGSLTGADVQNDSLTGDDVLESSLGKVGDADTLDGKDSTVFAERLFAVVNASGSVRAHRGLTTTPGVSVQPGFYKLTFDRDVTSCAVTGSQGARNNAFAGNRVISVNKSLAVGNEGIVNVRTQRLDTGAFLDENNDFDVQVVC